MPPKIIVFFCLVVSFSLINDAFGSGQDSTTVNRLLARLIESGYAWHGPQDSEKDHRKHHTEYEDSRINTEPTHAQNCVAAPTCSSSSKYRTIDGSCNNIANPTWGVPHTPYARILPYNYGDGIFELSKSKCGQPLPNARELSLHLFHDERLFDKIWNLNTMQWGQIIAHDMSLLDDLAIRPSTQVWRTDKYNASVTCCEAANGQLAEDVTDPRCAPVLIPDDDSFNNAYNVICQKMARTYSSRDSGCTEASAPAEPFSIVTAYMDLSIVYGNSEAEATPIRAGEGGRLVSVQKEGQEWPPNVPNVTSSCLAKSEDEPCFLAGDSRVNQNTQLTLLQVILLREHNRIADALAELNPQWDDETIFQEARRIHIAEMQYINYYEYLPILLGEENMIKHKLIYPGAEGYNNDYDSTVDPSILIEHASAALRHFHTLIRGHLQFMSENREQVNEVRISDWFYRPLILQKANGFPDLTRGLCTQAMDKSDQYVDNEIQNYLFKYEKKWGIDLRTRDIQRARDHGLGTYVAARNACGLSVPETFDDMIDCISQENIDILKSLYESPEDVDLVVAGSLENNVPGALAGPTFLCILTEQFYRTRVGDRYFFENGDDETIAFTPSQLESIRKSSMARIICDNVKEIKTMQPQAFRLIDSKNALVSCESIPSVDLGLWKEEEKCSQSEYIDSSVEQSPICKVASFQ